MEATGHCWKNLFVVLTTAGHDVALLNPLIARRFQESLGAGVQARACESEDAG
jgi:transposase